MARRRPAKRGPNWVQIVFYVLSFIIVLSMILSILPMAQ